MSKHTSAPWFVDEEASTDLFRYVMSEGYPNVICKIDRRANKRSEANARLIAAAPELLEALKAAQRWMPVYPASADVIVGGREAHAKAVESIRAAIAKAEGA